MEAKLQSLDLDSSIGDVTLSNGQRMDIPKLSMLKIIKIVKFLGIDGARLYAQCREIILDESLEELEKFAIILETLDEKQVVRIFSIMLDKTDEEVLSLDPNEMLEIAIVFVDKMDLKKTYSLIRMFMKKMFGKEMPESLAEWINQAAENRKKLLEMRKRAMETVQQEQAAQAPMTDGTNS